jgi:hypothetical protein
LTNLCRWQNPCEGHPANGTRGEVESGTVCGVDEIFISIIPMSLNAIQLKRRSGEESFLFENKDIAKLLDFWQWSFSNHMDNVLRGALAEFIVGRALDILPADVVRKNWEAWDLETKSGLKLEVKSAAYLQWWFQQKCSNIAFDIKPRTKWDPETNTYDKAIKRRADVYVFCLFTDQKNKESANPLNLNGWAFYVVETDRLLQEHLDATSVKLSTVKELSGECFNFRTLKNKVQQIEDARKKS